MESPRSSAASKFSAQLGAGVGVSVSSSADFKKAKTLATSEPSEQATLEIKKATYGKGEQVADITEKARQSVVSGSLSLKAGNDLTNGDPAPNTLKELRVEFSLNGKDEVKVVPEGESISLGGSKPWIIELPAGTTAPIHPPRPHPGRPAARSERIPRDRKIRVSISITIHTTHP